MTILPKSREQMIAFIEARLDAWAAEPAAIGLTSKQVGDLVAVTAAGRAALDAQTNAINLKLAATATMRTQTDAARDLAGDLIKVIRSFAELSDDPGVFDAALIPAPSPPTPAGAPEQPTELAAALMLPFGLELRWKGSVAKSTHFAVHRRLPGESVYDLIGTTRSRRYQDKTLPDAASGVQYYIAAIRDGVQVNSSSLSVQFGPGTSAAAPTVTLAA